MQLLERDPENRLGAQRGAAELQAHPFFASIDWAKLAVRRVSPPFKPVTHADDDEPDYYDNGGTWCFSGDKCWQQPRAGDGTRASPIPTATPTTVAQNGGGGAREGSSIAPADGGRGSSACRLVRNFTWVAKPSRSAGDSTTATAAAPEGEGDKADAGADAARGRRDNNDFATTTTTTSSARHPTSERLHNDHLSRRSSCS